MLKSYRTPKMKVSSGARENSLFRVTAGLRESVYF
jgi:hypothetical protein